MLPTLEVRGNWGGKNQEECLKQAIIDRLTDHDPKKLAGILPEEVFICAKMLEKEKGKIAKANKVIRKQVNLKRKHEKSDGKGGVKGRSYPESIEDCLIHADKDVLRHVYQQYGYSFQTRNPIGKRVMICVESSNEWLAQNCLSHLKDEDGKSIQTCPRRLLIKGWKTC